MKRNPAAKRRIGLSFLPNPVRPPFSVSSKKSLLLRKTRRKMASKSALSMFRLLAEVEENVHILYKDCLTGLTYVNIPLNAGSRYTNSRPRGQNHVAGI